MAQNPPGAASRPPGEGAGNVTRNSLSMAAGTFGSRILGFVRTALLTAVVGGALVSDAFTIGNSLPSQVYILVNGGLLSSILIPQLTKAMARPDGGQDFSDRLLTLSFLVLLVVTGACLATVPWIVDALSSNKDTGFVSLTAAFAYLCVPQIFWYGMYSVLGQVLNVYGQFRAFAWAPAWANIVQIAGLVYFIAAWGQQATLASWTPQMIWVLAGTTTLGIVLQGLALVAPLRRVGFRYRPRFGWRGYGFGEAYRMGIWTMAALGVSQLGGFVTTRAMTAGGAEAANVAGNGVQQYAFSVYILVHSLVTVSIVTALYPAMVRSYQQGDEKGLRRWVVQGLESPAAIVIPASVAMIALARPIAATLYPGLRFDPALGIDEPSDVALVLALMAIGTLPFGITALKQRYCFARSDGRLNFWLVLVMTVGNLITAVVAMLWTPAEYVVAVVALGGTLSNILAAGLFIVIARRQLHGLDLHRVIRLWVRLTLAAGIAGLSGWAVAGLIAAPASPWRVQATALAVGGLVLSGVFWAAARAMHIREVDAVIAVATARLGRLRRG